MNVTNSFLRSAWERLFDRSAVILHLGMLNQKHSKTRDAERPKTRDDAEHRHECRPHEYCPRSSSFSYSL
jgi:hypothetical protein